MTPNQKLLFYCFLLLNVTLVVMNLPAWKNFWGSGEKNSMRTLALLNTPAADTDTSGENSDILDSDIETPPVANIATPDANLPKLRGFHMVFIDRKPGAQHNSLFQKLQGLDWSHTRIDEIVRSYWETNRTFLEYQINRNTYYKYTYLTTSSHLSAAWIAPALLGLQTKPNTFSRLAQVPSDQNLVVYDNTKSGTPVPAPAIESIRKFVASRPSNESIYLQVDMYTGQYKSAPLSDHNFALHISNGQVSLYHARQDEYNLVDWMKQPQMFQIRYPMPLETFLGHLEKSLTYTKEESEMKERDQAIWEIFGITKYIAYGRYGCEDPSVNFFRSRWTISLITHWPSPQPTELTQA